MRHLPGFLSLFEKHDVLHEDCGRFSQVVLNNATAQAGGLNARIFLSTPCQIQISNQCLITCLIICISQLSFPFVQSCQEVRFRRVLPAGLRL